jgi:hypothetical protein
MLKPTSSRPVVALLRPVLALLSSVNAHSRWARRLAIGTAVLAAGTLGFSLLVGPQRSALGALLPGSTLHRNVLVERTGVHEVRADLSVPPGADPQVALKGLRHSVPAYRGTGPSPSSSPLRLPRSTSGTTRKAPSCSGAVSSRGTTSSWLPSKPGRPPHAAKPEQPNSGLNGGCSIPRPKVCGEPWASTVPS